MFNRVNLILKPASATLLPKRTLTKFVLPQRFKGTVVEKWADYWKNLFIDYKSMINDLKVEMQENPRKALKIAAAGVLVTSLVKNNPSMKDFSDQKIKYNNELALVGESCRNEKTVQHLQNLEKAMCEGRLRRLNCGIFSMLWLDDCDPDCDMYMFRCPYTAPGYLTPFTRVVDVGFVGQWWNIYRKFQDYDINEKELL